MSRPSVSCSARYVSTLAISVGVVGAALVEPEHRRRAGGAGPRDGELDPVADRDVLRLARPPDVAGGHLVLEQDGAGLVDDAHRAVRRDLERLVVRAVLLGGLGHQPDVGHRPHRRRVERAVGPAVVDDDLVDAGVAAVGDDGEGVVLGAVGTPHVARGADHRRHRGVDDDVGRDVEVRDAAVRVDHREARAGGEAGVDGGLDGVGLRHRRGRREQRAEAVVGADVGGREGVAELLEQRWEERPHDVAEDDRVGDLHHRRLEVHGEQDVVGLRPGDLGVEELAQRGDVHHGGVDDLAGEHRAPTRAAPWTNRRRRRARCAGCRRRR